MLLTTRAFTVSSFQFGDGATVSAIRPLASKVVSKAEDDGLNSFKEITDSILQSKTETYTDSGIEEIEMP